MVSKERLRQWAEDRLEHLLRVPPPMEGGEAAVESKILMVMEIWAMAQGVDDRDHILRLYGLERRNLGVPSPIPVFVAFPDTFQEKLKVVVEGMKKQLLSGEGIHGP